MEQQRTVVITGMGVISPIGLNPSEVASSLLVSRSGIGWVDASPLSRRFPGGIIRHQFEHCFSRMELPYLDRCQQMAVLAADQAAEDAGFHNFAELGLRAGLYYGSVSGGAASQQDWCRQFLVDGRQASSPYAAMAIMQNSGAAQVSIRKQIRGPVLTYNTACASSGIAIGEAQRAIRAGLIDIAIAGGAEACLVAGMLGMFDGTHALSPGDPEDVSRSCKPFSTKRRGLVLGEGAAFVVLESEQHARARKARVHAVMAGYGTAADGYHIGSPQASGQASAMRAALHDAGLDPADIHYLNAHATATAGGDVVEAEAIRSVFSGGADAVPVSSTKSLHGHLMGAASALELIVTIIAMRNSILPATAHLDSIDPRCDLNHVAVRPRMDSSIKNALSFSAGFGGTNVALVIASA
ncbi:MAG: beta-ketoacyl-[acyl-carrier-protein] synthase family protein [Herminiimonas sp.]|nr:beta-ketoacyl-[acyl-carrier-protein] synthase family protein [Herminiimonas sp.]MDB5853449.1 beta-ketoacyl-[acyl-carrier-protein] synthase family protein [Herminiimonas sp.]